jgi:hypothetical protein
MLKLSNDTNRNWFAKTEILLVASSIGSSVAAIIFQQVAFAAITSIPLSLAISLNSSNRKRLESVEQQHRASIIQLEQKFSDKQEFISKVLYSLPTHAELADVESRLEAYKSTFAKQLNTLNEQQSNTHLKLQQINNYHSIADLQQRLCILESLLQLHNPAHLHTELQENLVNIEAKIRKLEQQFNNLPISDLQHQSLQIHELVNKLQLNSTESTELYKCLLGEIQSISQQVQSVNSKTQELSLAHTEIQSQLKSLKALNIEKISSDTEFLYTFIDTEFQAFVYRVEGKFKTLEEQSNNLLLRNFQYRLAQVEQSLNKPQTTSNENTQKIATIDSHKKTDILCEHCHRPITAKYVMGGHFNNYKFHLDCKHDYEKKHL